LKLAVSRFDELIHLDDCFEFVVFVAAEEGAVRAKPDAIVEAYDF
jgi:hypothetical protein